jgi:hypothetical protein
MAVPLKKRASAEPGAGSQTAGGMEESATRRLHVVKSLPPRHLACVYKLIRKLCLTHIADASRRDPSIDSEGEVDDLSSEVFAKLFVASRTRMEGDPFVGEVPTEWEISDDPLRDTRVIWLIDQVGGQQALKHRQEDIRRNLHGGKWRGNGYRQVQLETEHAEGLIVEPDDPHREQDARKAWRGLLRMAVSEFKPGDDVLLLLDVMAHDHEVRAGFGKEWPIRQIVSALNLKYPIPPWRDDRVENAKKRLKNWIMRLMRIHGLDADDLKELFARQGREEE